MPTPPQSNLPGAPSSAPASAGQVGQIPQPTMPAAAPSTTAQTVFSRPAPGQVPGQAPGMTPRPAPAAAPSAAPKPLGTLPQPTMPSAVPPKAPGISGTVPPLPTSALRPTPMPTLTPTPAPAPMAAPVAAAGGVRPTPPPAPVAPPVKAEVKKPPFWLFAVIGVLILAGVGYFVFNAVSTKPTKSAAVKPGTQGTQANVTPKATAKPTTITYWGLWEPNEVMTDVIKDFETQYPQYTIDYRKQSFKDYRERLQTAIASGNGPDLFRFHATWVPMLQDDLAPLPSSIMTTADFEKTFYPVAAQQLELKGKVVGMPVMYDGLALYYNKAMLKSANAEPPQTWADLKTLADSLTVPANKSERGRAPLQRAGLAIGNSINVEHFSDILGLLILQNGGDPSAPNSNEVRDALLFYTNFVKEDKVWSEAMPSSTVAFARGDVAMMFAPSWRALDVKALNPDLDFGVAPVPQLGDKKISWATYWAEGVNAKSKNQQGAWTFINYLASADVQKKFFSSAAQTRAFGEPYARQELASELSTDPVLADILSTAPTAQSWYLTSFTHDNGLNDQLIKYYGDAVTSVLAGKGMDEVLTTLNAGTTQVLRQYNLSK